MSHWKSFVERPKPFTAICVAIKAHDRLEEDGETVTHLDDNLYCDMFYSPERKNYDGTIIPELVSNDEGYFTVEWRYVTHWCYMEDVVKILKESIKNG